VLYSRVFPFRKYNSPGAHREFLDGLARVLPKGCRPIIVTDAGFRGPWFRDVERLLREYPLCSSRRGRLRLACANCRFLGLGGSLGEMAASVASVPKKLLLQPPRPAETVPTEVCCEPADLWRLLCRRSRGRMMS
jgi:hypothetical protein